MNWTCYVLYYLFFIFFKFKFIKVVLNSQKTFLYLFPSILSSFLKLISCKYLSIIRKCVIILNYFCFHLRFRNDIASSTTWIDQSQSSILFRLIYFWECSIVTTHLLHKFYYLDFSMWLRSKDAYNREKKLCKCRLKFFE